MKWRDLPKVIQDKMLDYQEINCGNRDTAAFKRDITAGNSDEGFIWANTSEGRTFWETILKEKDLRHYLTRYPTADLSIFKPKISIGDTVIISKEPDIWNSSAGGNLPFNLPYPFEGVVENIEGKAIRISGYGFDLNDLLEKDLIKHKQKQDESRGNSQQNGRRSSETRFQISFGRCGEGLKTSNRERKRRSIEIGKGQKPKGEGLCAWRRTPRTIKF
jgi:hypothetical protein